MLKKYIGKNRAENLDWLLKVWLPAGPSVCFLQGFPGAGKTDLARDFRELAEKQGGRQHALIHEISDRVTPSVLESLMEVALVLSQQGLTEMETQLFGKPDPNLAYAVEKALQCPVVLILDEAQRFFHAESGAPLPELQGTLNLLRTRPKLPGRLLLLSDRMVQEARWSEWIPKRTLNELEPDEAMEVLETKLQEAQIVVDISPERKKDVVRNLDFNPRAIEALVGALRYDTLDEIMGSNPGLWSVRDAYVSRDFLRALERDLLERTMRHLDEGLRRKLQRLAVHRRNFTGDALAQMCGTPDEAAQLRFALVTRFLMNFYKGALALNPIVREISLSHLRDDPGEFRQAHSSAADYHLRHFKAKQIVGTYGKLGDSFAELRYHLVQAGRLDEVALIGERFSAHLKQEIKSYTPVPTNREELDERIGVLTVLLGEEGAKGLEYHLARCLQIRGKTGDLEQAVIHAERALGTGSREVNWHLLASLKWRTQGPDSAVAVIRRGLQALENPSGAAPLYQLGAEVLAKASKTKDAVALLNEGIETVPPDKNLFSLYQMLCEVFCRAGKPANAIVAAREGFRRIPEKMKRYKLAETALYLSAATSKAATLAEMLRRGDLGRQQTALGTVLQRLMQQDWRGAADTAHTARREFPDYFALSALEAFSRLAIGEAPAAAEALASFPNLTSEVGDPHGWLATFIHLRRGARLEAYSALSRYLGRTVDMARELNEDFLLRLWDEQTPGPETHRLCFQFPIMPASLSGLNRTIYRTPFAKPMFPERVKGDSKSSPPLADMQSPTPQVYVSYAWGEDGTPEGVQRERVVDLLCESLRANGIEIGRDKERLYSGDSIERFAQEISRAKRIVAVISAKFLNSEFCMMHELFRAYRRCDYQWAEFQEKIIALVMDEAKPVLQDKLETVSLAERWKQRFQQLRDKLDAIDPGRQNHDVWDSVDLMGEMVRRLPGMLGALRDIVMNRSFEETVRDGFQEVITRLHPFRHGTNQ